jgi:ABC superfamily ATP binding cassette transporter permease subunit
LAVIYFAFIGLGTIFKERIEILGTIYALFKNIAPYIIGLDLMIFFIMLFFLKNSIALINNKEYL